MKKYFCFSLVSFFIFHYSILFGQEMAPKEENNLSSIVLQAGEEKITQISEDPTGSLVAFSDGSCVTVFNTTDYSPVCELYVDKVSRMSFYMEEGNEYFAVMTKDGDFTVRKLLFDGELWSCEDGEPYFSADCSDVSGRKSLTAVSFSSNSDYVAAAFDDNTVQVHFRLRLIAGSISHTITSHRSLVYGLEFSKNGEYLATVSIDGNAYIWNSYTTSLITKISGVYARARVPVYFSEDSVYIISLESRNCFRISDFSGNTLYSILTGRPITAIKPLKDPDLIAIRNDKNEVMVYSISSRRPVSVCNAASDSDFTSFEFTLESDRMYAGYANGLVSVLECQPYLDDNSMLVTDSTLTGGNGKFIHQKFSSVSICGGTKILSEPFLMSADLRGEYLYSELISPFFVGGGFDFSVGYPRKDFPAHYKINGQSVEAPKALSTTLYAPAGYAFSPWNNDMRIITTLKTGIKMTSIALITTSGSILGKPSFSFFLSGGAGMQIKSFVFDINCEYDTVGKVSPSIYAGYVLRWGENR